MKFALVEASKELKDAYLNYIGEWEKSGDKIVPAASRRNGKEFEEVFNEWKLEESDAIRAKGYVPAKLYFFVNEENYIIGALHFRSELNERLLSTGGHIGYGIRPSERKKGYATKMLSLALPIGRKLGLSKVLITCNKDNLGSAGTIKNNGGVLENEVTEDNGNIVQRYWIDL